MSLRELDPKTVHDAVQAGSAVIIDVREPREFATERLHGASLHPLSTFDPQSIPVDKTRDVILQCGSGKRSMDALQRCEAAGVAITAHLKGGLMAWKAAGLPTVTIDPATGQVIDPK
ncbi:MAG: rhodanese-like domain-containing protein [Alphaproteobacteria bacterium]|jgi:rhodanese-related sulfurtransferase|uniref:rhodanese-like domain-containing protein n=1 Tax=Maricaulis alexandrii TaxID=2570354 RepID=UPI0011082A35|nr:rhodanese-like domain-containing protein [Maricaulis alexandrii]MCR9268100.1 rhodanese-like domain-containing protein [Alphaproteobacteria bacterium]